MPVHHHYSSSHRNFADVIHEWLGHVANYTEDRVFAWRIESLVRTVSGIGRADGIIVSSSSSQTAEHVDAHLKMSSKRITHAMFYQR